MGKPDIVCNCKKITHYGAKILDSNHMGERRRGLRAGTSLSLGLPRPMQAVVAQGHNIGSDAMVMRLGDEGGGQAEEWIWSPQKRKAQILHTCEDTAFTPHKDGLSTWSHQWPFHLVPSLVFPACLIIWLSSLPNH